MSVADLLAMMGISGQSWRRYAACRDKPKALFFGGPKSPLTERARAVCATCPVQPECLDYAIGFTDEGDEPVTLLGVWGGMTLVELMAERDRRRGGSGLRQCSSCGEAKPLTEFRVNRADHLRTRCALCENDYTRLISAAYRARRRAERQRARERVDSADVALGGS